MRISIAFALLVVLSTPLHAGRLQVAPVTVDVPVSSRSSSIALRNTGDRPVTMQARIFAWSQGGSIEVLGSTRAVVVSPPIVKVGVGKQAIIRIVRISKTPIAGEEAYRLVVDELPGKPAAGGAQVRMVMRYSIPVFFKSKEPGSPNLSLSATQQDGQLLVTATNYGAGHVKFSALEVIDQRGRTIPMGRGLVGYVLSESTKTFTSNAQSRLTGPTVTISAKTNMGPLETEVSLKDP